MLRLRYLITAFLLIAPCNAQATVVLASGAGYRAVVDALAASYEEQTGHHIELIYGNMARVTTQARATCAVDLVLGDAMFLLDKAKLPFSSIVDLGRGRLVAAFPKGGHFKTASDLLAPEITRIAIPETSKAIYGKAALQYLQSQGIYREVEPKLLIVATVPQAASYVLSGEVDLAMINLTHARKIAQQIGGYVVLDENSYDPIRIIIGQMEKPEQSTSTAECQQFLEFVQTEEAAGIIAAHGLQPK